MKRMTNRRVCLFGLKIVVAIDALVLAFVILVWIIQVVVLGYMTIPFLFVLQPKTCCNGEFL